VETITLKAILTGIIAAAILATITGFVLDLEVQQSVEERFATVGVRL